MIKTSDGEIELVTSHDRNGGFEPEIIRKRETILADSLQDRSIGMYGIGMSLRNISNHIKEMYDMEIPHDTLSAITDRIMPLVKEWQGCRDWMISIVWFGWTRCTIKSKNRAR